MVAALDEGVDVVASGSCNLTVPLAVNHPYPGRTSGPSGSFVSPSPKHPSLRSWSRTFSPRRRLIEKGGDGPGYSGQETR